MSDKIDRIENSPNKCIVRSEIVGQAIQYINFTRPKDFVGVTLPAKEYMFERLLYENLQHNPFVKHVPKLGFLCAEMNKKMCKEGIRHKPSYCAIAPGTIEDLLTGRYNYVGTADKGWLEVGPKSSKFYRNEVNPQFVWADYCGEPSKERIAYAVKSATSKKNVRGLYYFTFSVNRIGGGADSIHSVLGTHSKGYYAVTEAVKKAFDKCVHNHKVKVIYSVTYVGAAPSIMTTIGILVGNENIKPIVEDRNEQYREANKRNAQYHSQAKVSNFFSNLPEIIKKKNNVYEYVYPELEETEKTESKPKGKLDQATKKILCEQYDDQVKTGYKTRKDFVATFAKIHGVSSHTVGAILSWHLSEKLRAKKVNKAA